MLIRHSFYEFYSFIHRINNVNNIILNALEIIGKAIKKIPEEIRTRYPEIPWEGMAGMRNKVIHEYFGVNLKYIWATVKKRIPEIKPMFEKILRDLES
ncbi:MAG: HepT-like ribonuclease domain-containing protein [Nitrososphaerota archaeon]